MEPSAAADTLTLKLHPLTGLRNLPVGDAALLPIPAGVRPLRGLVGLVDWRLHGQLSRLLAAGQLSWAYGQTCLMPGAPYVPMDKLLALGVGDRGMMDAERLASAIQQAALAFSGLQAGLQVWPLMELAGPDTPPEEAADIFVHTLGARVEGSVVRAVVVGADAWMSRFRSQAEALIGSSPVRLVVL